MSGRGKKKKKRNGLTSWSPYRKTVHQEFRQEFLQARYVLLRLRDHCFLLWSHLPVYELLKFNSRKGNYSTSTLLLGVEFQKGVWIFLLSFSFFFLVLPVFLAEVIVLPHPLAHLTLLFGWRLLTCHHTLLTVERISPMSLRYAAQSAAGAGRAMQVNILCIWNQTQWVTYGCSKEHYT